MQKEQAPVLWGFAGVAKACVFLEVLWRKYSEVSDWEVTLSPASVLQESLPLPPHRWAVGQYPDAGFQV